jgi:hypothetical protein
LDDAISLIAFFVCGYFHLLVALIDVIHGKSLGSDDGVSAEVAASAELVHKWLRVQN